MSQGNFTLQQALLILLSMKCLERKCEHSPIGQCVISTERYLHDCIYCHKEEYDEE